MVHVTPSFYPAIHWGGPIFSILGLCNALAGISGCELRVLTTDAAGPGLSDSLEISKNPTRYLAGYDVHFSHRLFGDAISLGLLAKLWAIVRWADVVHLSYTYSFPTIPTLLACRLLRKPLVWSPHGALQATEQWKDARLRRLKGLWEWACSAVMPRNCVLYVASEAEKAASLARFPRALACVVPNGVDVPQALPRRAWVPGGVLRIIFIGRLDPTKGIENLLVALSSLKDSNVRLHIFGSGESHYAAKLAGMLSPLGLDGQVTFMGHVDGDAKRNAFLDADVCLVPSHIESFGMVVAEALAHGVPVIASRNTPWRGMESKGCGLWVDNSPESLASSIKTIRRRNLEEMGMKGREWMRESYCWDSIAKRTMRLYRDLRANYRSAK